MNAKENTPHTARMAHDQALAKVMQHLLKNDTQVYKQFVENESFKHATDAGVPVPPPDGGLEHPKRHMQPARMTDDTNPVLRRPSMVLPR